MMKRKILTAMNCLNCSETGSISVQHVDAEKRNKQPLQQQQHHANHSTATDLSNRASVVYDHKVAIEVAR